MPPDPKSPYVAYAAYAKPDMPQSDDSGPDIAGLELVGLVQESPVAGFLKFCCLFAVGVPTSWVWILHLSLDQRL